uniref:lysozyme n=1 Tax=Meloidogyne floridensis TaxID=298350 RepID=A0A915P5Q3_9BILA
MLYKIIIFIIFYSILEYSSADEAKCLKCICNHESGCKPLKCHWDVNSLSCGYFQIKLPYYKDCGSPMRKSGESIDSAWKRCSSDYQCSLKCVQAYIKRYQGKCPANMNACEKMSRVHNGGPGGCRSSSTNGYWAAIKKCHG